MCDCAVYEKLLMERIGIWFVMLNFVMSLWVNILSGIPGTFDVCFNICPCWRSLSTTSSCPGIILFVFIVLFLNFSCSRLFSSSKVFFLSISRAQRLERMEWEWACFAGCQKHILRQFQHCRARWLEFKGLTLHLVLVLYQVCLLGWFVCSIVCVKELWNYQMPWYMVTDYVVVPLK